MTVKEQREKLAALAKQMRELTDTIHSEDRDFSGEEEQTWKRLNDEYDAGKAKLERMERVESIESDLSEPADRRDRDALPGRGDHDTRNRPETTAEITEEHRALALQAWMRHQAGHDLSDAHQEACELVGMNPARRHLDIPLMNTRNFRRTQREFRDHAPTHREQRALSAVTDSLGGHTVPETMIRQLEVQQLAFGSVLSAADVMRTSSGEPMPWPTVNDTSNKGRQIDESAAVNSDDKPTFGQVMFSAYKFTSDELLVPFELLQDSAFDLATVIGDLLGERLGRIREEKYTTGTGNDTPHGVVTASQKGVDAAATAITWDDLIDLEHSVDPAYRQNASYMLHDDMVRVIRKLKDAEDRYIWQSNVRDGAPDTINGRRFHINQEMASTMENTAKTVLFGDFSKYKIREVQSVRFYRLVERHRENDQDAFLAFMRTDSDLLVPAAIKHLEHTT